jgi:hypothetical protein
VKERFFRIEAIGLPTSELASLLGVSEYTLARWIVGVLPAQEADIIEVALALHEMHGGAASPVSRSSAPTQRRCVAAA